MDIEFEPKDLEANVIFGFVLKGQLGDFLRLRKIINTEFPTSHLIFQCHGANAFFLVNWNDLSVDKQAKLKEVKTNDKRSSGRR